MFDRSVCLTEQQKLEFLAAVHRYQERSSVGSRLRTVRLRGIARTLKINGTKGNPARVFVVRTRISPGTGQQSTAPRITFYPHDRLHFNKPRTIFVHLPPTEWLTFSPTNSMSFSIGPENKM